MIIQVNLLNGFHGTNGRWVDFPPSPGRLYSALVSGMYKWHRENPNEDLPKMQEAFRYLEKLPLPDIYYKHLNTKRIHTPTVMVPLLELEDFVKDRREARFPRCFPYPYIYYEWKDNSDCWKSIDKVLDFVSYLGTPKSVAVFSLCDQLPSGKLTHIAPNLEGNIRLATIYEGRLRELDENYKSGFSAGHATAPYVEVSDTIPKPIKLYKYFLIYKMKGEFKPLIKDSAFIADRVRAEVLKICDGLGVTPPTLIGQDTTINHAAYIPLSNVGNEYSNGSIMGIGIALPDNKDIKECYEVLKCLGKFSWGDYSWELESVRDNNTANTLKNDMWCRPSCKWSTVTPAELHNVEYKEQRRIVYQQKLSQYIIGDRWADLQKNLLTGSASRNEEYMGYILKHCRELQLPEVEDVRIQPMSYFNGSTIAKHFVSRNRIMGRNPGNLVHFYIKFASKVQGPLCIGRGRNFGMGIMKPVR